MTTVTGTGPLEMKVLAAKLHGAPAELKKDLRRQFRQAAVPVVAAVEASVAAVPSHHDGTLRKQLARTVSARTSIRKSGVALDVVAAGTRMPAGKQNLTGYTDEAKGWRHPVYGNRKTWVRQVLKPGWFETPVIAQGRSLRHACEQAMNDVKRKLG